MDNSDGNQYYDCFQDQWLQKRQKQSLDKEQVHRYCLMCEAPGNRYSSIAKKTEISSRLNSIQLGDVKENGDDDYAISNKLKKMIKKPAPMVRGKLEKMKQKSVHSPEEYTKHRED